MIMKKWLQLTTLALFISTTGFAAGHEEGEGHHEALRSGHVDLLVLYEEAEGLHLAIAAGEHEHEHGEEAGHSEEEGHEHGYEELDHIEIVGGPKASQVIPEGAAWSFLGAADTYTYVFPQSEIEGLPFLGLNTEELDGALFASDPTLTLTGVEGPGNFALYQVDAFGEPLLLIHSTRETDNTIALATSSHVHMNWAFSVPGEYKLTFLIDATLADSTPITSEPQVVTFHVVGQPTYIHEGETVVAISYETDHGLEVMLMAHEEHHEEDHAEEAGEEDHGHEEDHEHGEGMVPADAVILLGGYSVMTIPESGNLAFLGDAGAPVYLLSQSEMEGVPFLAWDTDGLNPADFSGDPVLELHHFEGPGNLFLYALDAFGEPTVIWNTLDPGEDALTLPIGSHAHYNLALTQPGMYELEIHVKATLTDSTEVEAPVTLILQAGGP
jgi:surface-anchored protein